MRIAIVGRPGVGKESLLDRIFGFDFIGRDASNPLVDNNVPYEVYEYSIDRDWLVLGGPFKNITPRRYTIISDDGVFPPAFQRVDDPIDPSITMALYCVELTETFDEAIVRQDFAQFSDEHPGVPLALIGTKSDLATPELSSRFDALAQEKMFAFGVKTSAKNDKIAKPISMNFPEPPAPEAIPFIFEKRTIPRLDGLEILLHYHLESLWYEHDFLSPPPSLWKRASDELNKILVSENVPAVAINQINAAKTHLATMISQGPEDRATAIVAFNDTCNRILKDYSSVAKRALQIFLSAVVVALIVATISVAVGSYLSFCAGMNVGGFILKMLAGNALGKSIAVGSGAAGLLSIGFGIFEPSRAAKALSKFTKSVENMPPSDYEKNLMLSQSK